MKEFTQSDCMTHLPHFPDNFFDLAIVDPPYGIGRFSDRVAGNRIDKGNKINTWDKKPSPEYFEQILRVAKHCIIWGANNFNLPTSEYFIIWDKKQTVDNFASAEYAWTNFKMPAKVFRYSIHQEMQQRIKMGGKIHPTQKPVALYKWLLRLYSKESDVILDTHVGSASSLIAFEDFGCDYMGYEIDKDYYESALKRLNEHKAQLKLDL